MKSNADVVDDDGVVQSVDLNGKGVTVAVKDADKTTVNEKNATTGKPNYTY